MCIWYLYLIHYFSVVTFFDFGSEHFSVLHFCDICPSKNWWGTCILPSAMRKWISPMPICLPWVQLLVSSWEAKSGSEWLPKVRMCFSTYLHNYTPENSYLICMEQENEGLEDDFPFKRAHFQVHMGHFFDQLHVVDCCWLSCWNAIFLISRFRGLRYTSSDSGLHCHQRSVHACKTKISFFEYFWKILEFQIIARN